MLTPLHRFGDTYFPRREPRTNPYFPSKSRAYALMTNTYLHL
jgi:hypothetical protein